MARTVKQIKKSMTDEFMGSEVIKQKYGLSDSDTFETAFSAVSFESILFGIVASAICVLESIFDIFKQDVDKKVSTAVLASVPWYHKIALEYQHGDSLVFDEATMQYGYETVSPDKQVIKFAACRDKGGYVYVLAARADANGRPERLPDNILTPFKQYMNDLKPAGVPIDVYSSDPDSIRLGLIVQYDSLVLNEDGSLIESSSVFPVEDAVTEYLYGIEYGGVFNKTKLVDAVQNARGVKDVTLELVEVKNAEAEDYKKVEFNNYESVGGSFAPDILRRTIQYVLQI